MIFQYFHDEIQSVNASRSDLKFFVHQHRTKKLIKEKCFFFDKKIDSVFFCINP